MNIRQKITINIIKPALRRAGTMIGTYLAASGYGSDVVDPVVSGFVALSFIVVDLVASAINRKGTGK